MDKSIYYQNKADRLKILYDTYDAHYKASLFEAKARIMNGAVYANYRYLADKGLIEISSSGESEFKCRITAKGIDFVEKEIIDVEELEKI